VRCGSKSTFYKKGYYNDMHERPDVVDYRDHVYTHMCEKVELREPLWMILNSAQLTELLDNLSSVNPAALLRVRNNLLRSDPDVDMTDSPPLAAPKTPCSRLAPRPTTDDSSPVATLPAMSESATPAHLQEA
jgi:hypothetical protein